MLEQSSPERLQPVDRIHAGAGLERLQPMGRAHAGTEQKGEEETAGERNCCALTTHPHCTPHCAAYSRGGVLIAEEGIEEP